MTALILIGSSSPVHAFELGFIGGYNSNSPSISNAGVDATTSGSSGYELGAYFSQALVNKFSIEIDTILEHKSYVLGSSSTGTTYSLNDFQIPVFARYSIIPLFNVGLGLYWSSSFGSVSTNNGTSSTTFSQSYSAAGLSETDFGLTTSIQARIPVTPVNRLILDVRYNFGLSNLSTDSANSYKSRELCFLAGFSFGL